MNWNGNDKVRWYNWENQIELAFPTDRHTDAHRVSSLCEFLFFFLKIEINYLLAHPIKSRRFLKSFECINVSITGEIKLKS